MNGNERRKYKFTQFTRQSTRNRLTWITTELQQKEWAAAAVAANYYYSFQPKKMCWLYCSHRKIRRTTTTHLHEDKLSHIFIWIFVAYVSRHKSRASLTWNSTSTRFENEFYGRFIKWRHPVDCLFISFFFFSFEKMKNVSAFVLALGWGLVVVENTYGDEPHPRCQRRIIYEERDYNMVHWFHCSRCWRTLGGRMCTLCLWLATCAP